MLATSLIALAAMTTTGPGQPTRTYGQGTGAAPCVELWTDRDVVVERGDRVRVYFQTDIASRGGRFTFRIDDYPGQGYVFAITSVDPFRILCFRFRIMAYDDPYYYPARRYPGTQVVYPTRRTMVPRYVFGIRDPDREHVVRVRERPVDDNGRRRIAAGATRWIHEGGARLPALLRRELSRPAETMRRRPAANPELALPAQRPRLERRDPARVDPRRSPPRRTNPPKRRKN